MASLPSTNSIVDYLNSTGQDSSFSARRTLFNEAGLNKTLGDFAGSANQNLTLLKSLRTSTQNPSFFEGKAPASAFEKAPASDTVSFFSGQAPPNAFEAEKTADLFKSPALSPFADALNFNKVQSDAQRGVTIEGAKGADIGQQPSYFNLVESFKKSATDKPTSAFDAFPSPLSNEERDRRMGGAAPQQDGTLGSYKGASIPAGSSQEEIRAIIDRENAKETEAFTQRDKATSEITGGVSASTILGQRSAPSEAELVDQYLNSTEGKLALEKLELKNMTAQAKADALKQDLETKHAAEKESLNNKLAASGLAFSGIRGTQVKSLADSLASSILGVDREFATKLLDADINFRETILDGVADLLKAAQNNEKDAIAQLNKAGYAVIGDQLVPTLARENASVDDIRADANLAISQRRLELAEQANARAAATAAKGDSDKEALFATIFAMMSDPENEDVTDEEWEAELRAQTGLSGGDVSSLISIRPPTVGQYETDAAFLVGDHYADFKPSFFGIGEEESIFQEGDQKPAALAKAKEAAIKELKDKRGVITFKKGDPIKLTSSSQIQTMIDTINSITLDDI